MDRQHEASRCRQRIADGLARLTHLAQGVQGRAPMVRASLYRYRRRCGAQGCRCARGELHEGRALSVSDGGRSKAMSLVGLDVAEVSRGVEASRHWRRTRTQIVRTFAEVLEAVDQLGRLRTVPVERLRRAGMRPQ